MKKMLRIGSFGLIIWLIPFVFSFLFWSPDGNLLIDKIAFKTIMLLVASITGAICLVIYYKKVNADYLKEGIIVGVVWLLVNWILDFIILIPMANIGFGPYFIEVGLCYLMFPTMCISTGYILNRELSNNG